MIPLSDDNPTRRVPIVTLVLIAINVGVYFFVQPGNRGQEQELVDRQATLFAYEWAAVPCEVTTGEPVTAFEVNTRQCQRGEGQPAFPDKPVYLAVLFSMFFHGSLLHLAGNVWFLWIFGNNIEDKKGRLAYLPFYLVSGVVATLAHVLVQPSSTVPLVGASGAVAGVMGAYLIFFPSVRIRTIFLMFLLFIRDVQAKWLLLFWLVSQFFVNPNAGIAWMAHVGGFVFGALFAVLWRAVSSMRARDPYALPE